jgi:hypothetical protein
MSFKARQENERVMRNLKMDEKLENGCKVIGFRVEW